MCLLISCISLIKWLLPNNVQDTFLILICFHNYLKNKHFSSFNLWIYYLYKKYQITYYISYIFGCYGRFLIIWYYRYNKTYFLQQWMQKKNISSISSFKFFLLQKMHFACFIESQWERCYFFNFSLKCSPI